MDDKMEGLTLNEAALIYCILGEPGRVYPTVEEALSYMKAGRASGNTREKKPEKKKPVVYEQLTFM